MKRSLKCGMCLVLSLLMAALSAAPAGAEELEEAQAAAIWNGSLSAPVGWLEDGAALTVLEEGANYYRIDCYDTEGYIRRELVAEGENGEYYVNCKGGETDVVPAGSFDSQTAQSLRREICEFALNYVGTPYYYGGTTPAGFDCSGFVQYVYRNCGIELSRVVTTQLGDGRVVSSQGMQPGDLVIFHSTDGSSGPSHIGIYLGEGEFIHASYSRGVIVSSLTEDYYSTYFLCARRVVVMEKTEEGSREVLAPGGVLLQFR